MATSFMSQADFQEEADFSLKFVMTSLSLMDSDELYDVLVSITFDSCVIKIENLEENDDGEMKPVGRELVLQLPPEKMSEKLRACPIMLNLVRGCDELGTQKLIITDCFADAVKCEEFSSETVKSELKFVTDGKENASMDFVFQVSRSDENSVVRSVKAKKGKKTDFKEEISTFESSDTSFSDDVTDPSFASHADLPTMEPIQPPTTLARPTSSLNSKSSRFKCCSDIAASLDVCDFPNNLKTFCNTCGRFSISGITCDNESFFPGITAAPFVDPPKAPLSETNEECEPPTTRICSECFDDLSAIPQHAPCPTCVNRIQMDRKLVSFKSEKTKLQESQHVHNCIKSIIDEVFLGAKDRFASEWDRLNKPEVKKPSKKKREMKKPSGSVKKAKSRSTKSQPTSKKKFSGLRTKHPGVILGHHLCGGDGTLVPKNMGWLWNVKISGLPTMRRGWRPGAVRKSVAKIMKFHLRTPAEATPEVKEEEPPTLRVQKKNGEYVIVMNPLRDGAEESSPIVFKVGKSEDSAKRLMARNILKTRDVKKTCSCSTIDLCGCLNERDKAYVKTELQRISKNLGVQMRLGDLKDSSDSELDVEFTPPAATKVKNPCFRCKPVKVSVAETQYEVQMIQSAVDARKDGVGGLKIAAVKDLKKEKAKLGMKIKEKSMPGKLKEEKSIKEKLVPEKLILEKPKSKDQKKSPLPRSGLMLRPLKKSCNVPAPNCDRSGCRTKGDCHFGNNCDPCFAECMTTLPACSNYGTYRAHYY